RRGFVPLVLTQDPADLIVSITMIQYRARHGSGDTREDDMFGSKRFGRGDAYPFTDRARRVLAMAQEEAARLHHDYVGTEHIQLGLTRDAGGEAARIVDELGVPLDAVRAGVHECVREGKPGAREGELPYTSRARKVVEYARASAAD